MSQEDNEEQLGSSGQKGPVSYFAEFCREEKERRMESEADFDEEWYDMVVDLVAERLEELEVEE